MKKFNAKIFKNLNYKTKQLRNNLITMHIDISIDPYQYIMEELKSITYSLKNIEI